VGFHCHLWTAIVVDQRRKLSSKETILDLTKIITELKSERDRIGRAISALLDDAKAAVVGATTTRKAAAPASTRRGKGLTAAGRKRLSEAMKRRWADRRGKGSSAPKAAAVAAPKRRGGLTPAGRKKLSEAMKRRWAERKKKAS
jgi:hypothetical protein